MRMQLRVRSSAEWPLSLSSRESRVSEEGEIGLGVAPFARQLLPTWADVSSAKSM